MKKIIIVFIMSLFVSLIFIDYGKALDKTYDAYSVGDELTIKNEKYYVISDSSTKQDYVTVLKAEPLLYSQMVNLLPKTGIADKIADSTAFNNLDTTQLDCAFIYSDTCSSENQSGCNLDYLESSVKKVVDLWASNKFPDQLKPVDGYSARLIKFEELEVLGYSLAYQSLDKTDVIYLKGDNTPDWVYGDYWYWTMTPYENSNTQVFALSATLGDLLLQDVYKTSKVRPVINIYKDKINDLDENNFNTIVDNNSSTGKNNSTGKAKVANTLSNRSVFGIVIGLILSGIGISIFLLMKLKENKS